MVGRLDAARESLPTFEIPTRRSGLHLQSPYLPPPGILKYQEALRLAGLQE